MMLGSKKLFGRTVFLGCLCAVMANAQLVQYGFQGISSSVPVDSYSASSTAAHITASAMSHGTGVSGDYASRPDGAMKAKDFATTSLDLNDYFSFTVTPGLGYSMSITEFRLDSGVPTPNSDPTLWTVRSSIDGFTSDLTTPRTTTPSSGNWLNNQSFSISSLNNISQPVTFRIYAWGATELYNAGTPHDYRAWAIDNVGLSGNVSPVPEPYECGLIAVAGLLGYGFYDRRRLKKA
jgi:hypothetical protein